MATESQYVTSFDATNDEWAKSGSTPYLDEGVGSYVDSSTKKAETGYYDFPAFSLSGTLQSVTLYLFGNGTVTSIHDIEVYDGSGWTNVQIGIGGTGEYSVDISAIINSIAKLNAVQINIIHENDTSFFSNF